MLTLRKLWYHFWLRVMAFAGKRIFDVCIVAHGEGEYSQVEVMMFGYDADTMSAGIQKILSIDENDQKLVHFLSC